MGSCGIMETSFRIEFVGGGGTAWADRIEYRGEREEGYSTSGDHTICYEGGCGIPPLYAITYHVISLSPKLYVISFIIL